MKKAGLVFGLLAVVLFVVFGVQAQMGITGAGATFPQPVYAKWAHKYFEVKKVQVNYQGIGSGGGIAQIKARTVDFGGTDEPLKPEELREYGLFQFPTVVGGVVPIFNLPGVAAGSLHLDGPTLAGIFLGEISRWNDPALRKLNPDLNLPDKEITVVHRSDGSGTTFIFTSYLATVSPEFKAKVGVGKAVSWPAKNSVGAKGNPGVAGQVQNIQGAIGYVEYAYALQNNIPYASLKNKAGKFVKPSLDSFAAAAANADWEKAPAGFAINLIEQPGDNSWPIVGATWILIHKDQPDAAKGKALLSFFDWAFQNGGEAARELHYVVLPAKVVKMVQDAWTREIKAGGRPIWP